MERNDAKPRQRAIIYANATRRRRHDASSGNEFARDAMPQSSSPQYSRTVLTAAASALSVPSWFDLPLILPDANPIGARVQRGLAKLQLDQDDERSTSTDYNRSSRTSYQVPKISHLSPTKDALRHKLHSRVTAPISTAPATDLQHFIGKSHLHKKRRTTHAGAAVVLDRIDRKSRLREEIWRDLSRFGLWYLADEAPDGAGDSVDKTVDAIMQQWESASPMPIGSRGLSRNDSSSSSTPATVSSEAMSRSEARTADTTTKEQMNQSGNGASHAVFLTALPPEATIPVSNGAVHDNSESHVDDDVPEDNDNDENEDDEETEAHGTSNGAPRLIRTPGMKRRARLKELHGFVEKQLQKRLYKSWDTIELAFTGTGDLTTAQIVKFLQHSDVQLSASDAAKVQAILQSHTRDRQASDDADGTDDEASESHSSKTRASAAGAPLVSFNAFRRLFHTTDAQEAAKWKREFMREKTRERQEKAIYERELAALEEKVKKRLAESARHMVDVLAQFRVDPLALPWESEAQRLALRAQLFETIFTKPQRRQLIVSTTTTVSLGTDTAATSVVPSKLSTKVVEAALLQKYSRNGHFDAIEVPDAAYLFHDFAADCIKSSVQRYWVQCAADAWPERQRIFAFRRMKQVFYEWRRFTKHAETLRRYVLRKFVAWQHWTAKLHAHYAFVRMAFWPFYTWKRHLQQMIIARGKSAFLTNVVRTYVQLRHFRALKTQHQQRQWTTQHTARLRAKRARKVLQIVWSDWTRSVQSRIVIHRLWKSRGHALQRLHKLYMVKVTFTLWRYYALLQNDLRRRQHKCLLEQFSRPRTNAAQHHPHYHHNHHHHRPHAGSPTKASSTVLSPLDAPDVDTTTTGAGDSDGEPSSRTSSTSSPTVPALSRIMETSLGQHIKRKSRLYDLCLALYLACREKDRRTMVGNVVTFRRIARALLAQLKARVVCAKKNRFATDLGAFRVLHERFRQWKGRTLYEQQLRATSENGTADLADGTDDMSGSSDDSDDDTADHRTVDSLGRVKLHWRRDRAWRQHAIVHNPMRAQALVQDLHTVFESDARRSDAIHARERELKRKQHAEDAFLRKEAGATLKVKAAQLQQAQQVLRTRAHRMHDVLDRVFDDLIAQRTRQQLRSSFRSLRVVVMLKLTTTLCHRAQLRNWLRLCVRFAYWDRHVRALCRMRVKFHAFQSLLKHAVWKWQCESPGLSRALQQRRVLAIKYETYLDNHSLLDGSDAAARLALTKYSPANALRGLFLRWVQFTQFAYAARQIVALTRHKRALAQLQSVFVALQHHVKSKYTLESRQHARPFLLRQAEADLDAYHCKLLALRARLPTTLLRKALARKRQRLLRAAAGSPTLKQLFDEHEREVRRRLSLEHRLMFSAYAERKVHHYTERSSPLYGAPVGRAFAYEPAPPYSSISDIAVLYSKQVDGLSLVVKTPASGAHEGALHGNPFGTREVFALAKGEVLVSIEGFASQTLYALRFGTSAGRVSKWFGQCDKGTKFEIRSDFSTTREEIVGVFGYADGTSLHALGAVLRRTTVRNIFEGLWLQPDALRSSDDVALCDRQFAYFLQVRTCDVLAAMARAHRFALRAYRATHQPPALLRMRVVMALARWLFNALVHGLVHCTAREADGKRMLEHGMATRTSGEKLLQDGLHTLAVVDSFRDDEQQLNVATLGAKKIAELREMMEQAQQRIAAAKLQIADGDAEVLAARRMLPHLPMTKRMMTAIRRMYRVVQTKDYIDQMDPDVRAILLIGDSASGSASSASDFATPAASTTV